MSAPPDHVHEDALRVPIVEETLRIDKTQVETGRVIVTSAVHVDTVDVRDTLESRSVRVERVPIGHFIDAMPQIRTEPGRTIVPVVEEVMVKRLRLVEEVHLVTETNSEPFDQSVALRRLDVTVERTDPADMTRP